MIFDHVSHIDQYITLYPSLQCVIPFLKRIEKESLKPGIYEIDGRTIYAMIQEYETQPEDTLLWECHRRYIDLQMILEGEEEIGWSECSKLIDCGEYDEVKDVMMAADSSDSVMLKLSAGRFVIFMPHDAHKPLCLHKVSGRVKKVVIKMAV